MPDWGEGRSSAPGGRGCSLFGGVLIEVDFGVLPGGGTSDRAMVVDGGVAATAVDAATLAEGGVVLVGTLAVDEGEAASSRASAARWTS